MTRILLGMLIFMCCAQIIYADDLADDPAQPTLEIQYNDLIDRTGFSFNVEPVALNSEQTDKESIGASYLLNYVDKELYMEDSLDLGTLDLYPKAVGYQLDAGLRGTVTESEEENPLNFQEAHLSLEGQYLVREMYSAGGFVKYEFDQGLDERQFVFGAKARFGRSDNLPNFRDLFVIVIGYGRVHSSQDSEREAVLTNSVDDYDRAELEAHWQVNLGGVGPESFKLSSFEVNYRYFQEIDAESVIKDADLDDYRLLTFLLRVNKDWSIAYSSGELPFNRRDDRIFKVGYTFQFN